MSRAIVRRLFSPSICASCRARLGPPSLQASRTRPFSASANRCAEGDNPDNRPPALPDNPYAKLGGEPYRETPVATTTTSLPTHNAGDSGYAAPTNSGLSRPLVRKGARSSGDSFLSSIFTGGMDTTGAMIDLEGVNNSLDLEEEKPPHKLHVYATKHNTHITLSTPPYQHERTGRTHARNLISVSCGNIGFRKSGRGSYDAAFQLAAFVMARIRDRGWLLQIKKLEIVLRGFGPGREAVSKALQGMEGRNLRGAITTVTDATRLKFGGTRSPAPRRLG